MAHAGIPSEQCKSGGTGVHPINYREIYGNSVARIEDHLTILKYWLSAHKDVYQDGPGVSACESVMNAETALVSLLQHIRKADAALLRGALYKPYDESNSGN